MNDIEKHTQDNLSLSKEDLETLFESTFEQINGSTQKNTKKKSPKRPLFGSNSKGHFKDSPQRRIEDSEIEKIKTVPESRRVKSSLRMKYESEVEVIKKTHGDLEKIRRQLRLSKRKVAQLLLVDPSAWTRWTAEEGEAPPHIYRALQWYLILQDKHPEYKSSLWLNSVATPQMSEKEIENIKKAVVYQARNEMENSAMLAISEMDDRTEKLTQQLEHSKQKLAQTTQKMKQHFYLQTGLTVFLIIMLLVFR